MREQEIEKTVVEAQRGSEEALADLYKWFLEQRQFFNCAYRILRDWEEDIYDVMQESAIKISRNIDRYDPDKSTFSNWCYRIVKNAAIDQFRKRVREKVQPLRIVPSSSSTEPDPEDKKEAEMPSSGPLPDRAAEAGEVLRIINEAEEKAGLSTRQKLVWRLYRAEHDISSIAMSVMGNMDDKAQAAVHRDKWRAGKKIEVYLWTNYPDWSESHQKVTLLFGTESKFQTDLDNGSISEELQREFENHSITPPRNVIVPGRKKGSMWLITDKDKPIYLVRKERDRLNVYR